MTNTIADVEFYSNDLGRKLTVSDYLRELLVTLWNEEECFNGKRPFGNSGWQGDIERVLIDHSPVNGEVHRDGEDIWVDWIDREEADLQMRREIQGVFEDAEKWRNR